MTAVLKHDENFEPEIAPNSPFANVQSVVQLGQLLNTIRRAQQREIAPIAQDLHLKPRYLEALEAGDWEQLPGNAYARGYLKQYAEYLGLSPDEVVQCCNRIQGRVDSKLHYLDIVSNREAPKRHTLWLSFFTIIILLLIWVISQQEQSVEVAETISPPPPLLETEEEVEKSIYPVSSCLNIPGKTIDICAPEFSLKPSIILTESAIYPIWIE
jgi:cytoskeletal protein RodZ